MGEVENATRAPENDASEQNSLSSAEIGEHCVKDRPAPVGSSSSGEITKLGNADVYISKPNDYPHRPSKLLLFLTGGTGLHSKNNQLQADKFANHGFLVVMPDMFENDPASNQTSSAQVEEPDLTIIEQIKLQFADVAKSFVLDMWLARHTPEKVQPILHSVIEGAQDEFADAVASGAGIYCVGYCFGAKYCLQLAREVSDIKPTGDKVADEEAAVIIKSPYVKAGAIAHGTLITKEDFEGLKSPISLVCVENDQLFSQEVLDHGKQYMKDNNVPHEIKMYPKVPHGFAVVGEYDDSSIKTAQEQAFDQMLSWLQAH